MGDGVGRRAECGEVVAAEQFEALGRAESFAGNGFLQDGVDHRTVVGFKY